MKTIAELSLECGVHRTTLNKAIKRKEIDAILYGKTYVIDTESKQFKHWLAGSKLGRPRKSQASPS